MYSRTCFIALHLPFPNFLIRMDTKCCPWYYHNQTNYNRCYFHPHYLHSIRLYIIIAPAVFHIRFDIVIAFIYQHGFAKLYIIKKFTIIFAVFVSAFVCNPSAPVTFLHPYYLHSTFPAYVNYCTNPSLFVYNRQIIVFAICVNVVFEIIQ